MSDRIWYALDADDLATRNASAAWFQMFAQDISVKHLKTQASYLVTDVRLHDIPRQDHYLNGINKWGIDVYRKLAGFETVPGENTQVLNAQGETMYDRFDNRELGVDTPALRSTYVLNGREMDLLLHAGAYDNLERTEQELRQNLVGSTYSVPDDVIMTTYVINAPQDVQAVKMDNQAEPNYVGRFAVVNDASTLHRFDAHTPHSNFAQVLNGALTEMAPNVQPMADMNKDLEAAKNVKAISKDHVVQSQTLDQEIDLDAELQDQSEPMDNSEEIDSSTIQPSRQTEQETNADDMSNKRFQNKLAIAAAKDAGLDLHPKEDASGLEDPGIANGIQKLNQSIADYLPNTPAANKNQRTNDQTRRDSFIKAPTADELNLNVAGQQSTNNEQSQVNNSQESAAADVDSQIEQVLGAQSGEEQAQQTNGITAEEQNNQQQLKRQRQKSQAMQNEQTAENDKVQQQANNAEAEAGNGNDMSLDDMQKLLNQLQAEGAGKGYKAPDYEKARKNSPAYKRQQKKLAQRKQAQAAQAKSDAEKAAKAEQANVQLPDYSKLFNKQDDGPEL